MNQSVNKNQILVKVYDVLYESLVNKAIRFNINPKELEWYFDPLSDKHIDYYNKKYKINLNKAKILNGGDEFKNFLFMRFTSSLFNKGNEYYITHNEMEKELAKSLKGFDLNYFNTFNSFKDYFTSLANNSAYSNLIGNKMTNKNQTKNYLQVLYESLKAISNQIQNIIKTYPMPNFINATNYQSFDKYYDVVTSLISNKHAKKYKGLGLILLADAVKEAGIIDTLKPDRHVQNTLFEVFNKGEVENVSQKSFKKMLEILYDIAHALKQTQKDVSIYQIDKIIYMICAQGNNGFYLHTGLQTDREKLIDDLLAIPGIDLLKY